MCVNGVETLKCGDSPLETGNGEGLGEVALPGGESSPASAHVFLSFFALLNPASTFPRIAYSYGMKWFHTKGEGGEGGCTNVK